MDDTLIDLNDGMPDQQVSVSEFVDLVNQTFEYTMPSIVVSGELANLRISKGRWVYFDLKDEFASVKCFATVQHLPGPLEDGMILHVRGTPRMHSLYGFSFNVQFIQTAGEGSIRRAAELLARQLEKEGLFEPSRKRDLAYPPQRIGLITSAQSAAYADFTKILGARWGGIEIQLVDVQVQGEPAVGQICAAINKFGEQAAPPELLVMIRGGGSADDLAAWSTEQVTRAVAASRVPTLVAIGHEVDVSLAELAADRRASTPSNAAELLTPDKRVVVEDIGFAAERLYDLVSDRIADKRDDMVHYSETLDASIDEMIDDRRIALKNTAGLFAALSPEAALKRGYAIVRDSATRRRLVGDAVPTIGTHLVLQMHAYDLDVIVHDVHDKPKNS